MVDDHVALYTRLLEADPEDRGGRVMDDAVAAGATIGRGRTNARTRHLSRFFLRAAHPWG